MHQCEFEKNANSSRIVYAVNELDHQPTRHISKGIHFRFLVKSSRHFIDVRFIANIDFRFRKLSRCSMFHLVYSRYCFKFNEYFSYFDHLTKAMTVFMYWDCLNSIFGSLRVFK